MTDVQALLTAAVDDAEEDHGWRPDAIRRAMAELVVLELERLERFIAWRAASMEKSGASKLVLTGLYMAQSEAKDRAAEWRKAVSE